MLVFQLATHQMELLIRSVSTPRLENEMPIEEVGKHVTTGYWFSKAAAITIPSVLLPMLAPTHELMLFAIGLSGGILIQAAIPPRLSWKRTFAICVCAIAAVFILYLLDRGPK